MAKALPSDFDFFDRQLQDGTTVAAGKQGVSVVAVKNCQAQTFAGSTRSGGIA